MAPIFQDLEGITPAGGRAGEWRKAGKNYKERWPSPAGKSRACQTDLQLDGLCRGGSFGWHDSIRSYGAHARGGDAAHLSGPAQSAGGGGMVGTIGPQTGGVPPPARQGAIKRRPRKQAQRELGYREAMLCAICPGCRSQTAVNGGELPAADGSKP